MARERLLVAGLFGIPVLAAAAMVAWSAGQPASAQTTASSARLGPLVGWVRPSETVELASSEKGTIQELAIKEGDMVKKGQVVCRLESSVEQASLEISKVQAESKIDVDVAKIRHELADIQLKKVLDLEEKQFTAPMEVDEAKVNEKYARGLIDKALHDQRVAGFQFARDRKVIDRRTIQSPLNGYVAERIKSVGELVDGVDDTTICRIVKLDPLHVCVVAPAEIYGKIRRGGRATLDGEQLPGGTATAEVILVDRLVQADSQTYTIKLELANAGIAIPAGIKVMVTFP
jgi:RND family efflux transporter MFP subunit